MKTGTEHNKTLIFDDGLDLDDLRSAIREEYEAVACMPERGFHFHTGRKLTRILGYVEEWLEGIPEPAIESFAGTGNPFSVRRIRPGERVVDVGSGSGMDSLVAAKYVGPKGRVIGVDMTSSMVEKARESAEMAGFDRVEFRHGYAEDLPVDDEWADVVISNGVLNLTPDKSATLREMYRVLNDEGRLQIADILVQKPVPLESKQKPELWTGCIAGALQEDELRLKLLHAGFVDVKITWWADVYRGAPQSSSADHFGTVGINFFARKPANRDEWEKEMDSFPLLY